MNSGPGDEGTGCGSHRSHFHIVSMPFAYTFVLSAADGQLHDLRAEGNPQYSSPRLVQNLPALTGIEVQGTGLWHTIGLGICPLVFPNPKTLLPHKAAPGHNHTHTHHLSIDTHTLPSLYTHTHTLLYTHIPIHTPSSYTQRHRWERLSQCLLWGPPCLLLPDAHTCWSNFLFTQV